MGKKWRFEDWIVEENDDFIFINKPPGISSLEDRNDPVCVLRLAKEYWSDAQLCHRLDKETSGMLVIAKTPEAYRHLAMRFESRKVRKYYHALVAGIHDLKSEDIDKPILLTGQGIVRISHEGKPSRTIVNTLEAYRKHSLLECQPVTGRMHQIRVHLAAIGAPICGDIQYGGEEIYLSSIKARFNLKKWTEERPLIGRVALHAHSIAFETPDGSPIQVAAPYPKDYAVLLKQLEKNR